jgi:hypothetical protein
MNRVGNMGLSIGFFAIFALFGSRHPMSHDRALQYDEIRKN